MCSLAKNKRKGQRRPQLLLEMLEPRRVCAVIGVDAAAGVHPIAVNIYGSAFASTVQLADLRLPLNRNGGNASDTYSFAQDATNHANDWYFESIPVGTGNGQGMDTFISDTRAGGALPSVTLNMFDWAAKLGTNRSNLGSFPVDTFGPQQSTDPWNSNLGNGVTANGTNITGNDPNLAYIANNPTLEQAWIQHLINTFGTAASGGVQYYTLGNEPGIWNSTHRDIHPNGDTLTELRDRTIAYASMVKGLDPGAQILGPEEWGWTNYYISGADAAAQDWGATYDGLDAEAWLLSQLRQHDAATGQRLLDYFTLHFYPQGGQFSDDVSTNMELLRNRSTRSLWDSNYVDESWIASTGINGGKVDLIDQMKNWVTTYYPGTKLGITEYNWGAEGNMNGATTQADIWGIFGREGLDLANRWGTPATGTPAYLAMKMFRNYDGAGSAFGDTSVSASVGNPDQVDAFASTRAADGSLTVMVVNKNLYDPNNPSTSVTVDLSNFLSNGTAEQWQLAASDPADQTKAAITHLGDVHWNGSSFTSTVPMESVTLFVIKPRSSTPTVPAAPTGVTATGGNAQVVVSWATVNGAATYNIYRGTATGAEVLLQAGVAGSVYTDTATVNGTTYYYQVSAVNATGEGARSVETRGTTVAPIMLGPSGLIATDVPAFGWSAVSGASAYELWVDDLTTGQSPAMLLSNLPGTSLNLTSAQALSPGHSYRWWVLGLDGNGPVGDWSDGTDFSIQPLNVPALNGPVGAQNSDQITFAWSGAALAVNYEVWLSDLTSGTGDVLGYATTTTLAAPAPLTPGHNYRWWVLPLSSNGSAGDWSDAADFAIPTMTVSNLTGPLGTQKTDQVTFAWSAAALAVKYEVWLSDLTSGSGDVLGYATGTTLAAPAALSPGHSYRWWVLPLSSNGSAGDWSAPADFAIQALEVAAPLGPTGTQNATQVTFAWSGVALATRYEVWLSDLTDSTGDVLGFSTSTSLAAPAPLISGHAYRWWILSLSSNGTAGDWSTAADFTVA